MSDLEAWRDRAAAWCESMAPTFGKAARSGLSVEDDLALGRRYQKAKFDAGFAGINWPKDVGGQGLGHLEKIARSEEHTSELQSLMRNSYAVFRLKKNNNNR